MREGILSQGEKEARKISIKPEDFLGSSTRIELLWQIRSLCVVFDWHASKSATSENKAFTEISINAAKKLEKLLQEWRRVSSNEIG